MTTLESTTVTLGACPHDCPDTCSMVVTVDGGRVTKVRGNPDHPFTQGGLCVKVTDFPNHIYAADRVTDAAAAGRTEGRGPASSRSRGTTPSTRSPTATGRSSPSTAPRRSCPTATSGTMGVLNGLTVGDRFFNALGTSVSERTFCDGGGITGYIMTLGPDGGRRPRVARALPVHHHLGLQRAVQQPAPVAVHRGGPAARRQGRVHRPGAPTARRRRPTGTSRSGPAPTARWPWR